MNPSPNLRHLTVPHDGAGRRVDAYLSDSLGVARNQCAKWIKAGLVLVNGGPCERASARLQAGDSVSVDLPEPPAETPTAQKIELAVIHEDDQVIVVNKPAGLVVHPAPGHPDGTLVNALLHHCGSLSTRGGEGRAGIVHRLDRDTSGLMVAAKTDEAHEHLQAQFAAHSTDRHYLALAARTHGRDPEDRLTIQSGHSRHPGDRRRFTGKLDGGRRAITHATVLERFRDGALLMALRLETGRTHQIRMHLSELGTPILGDPLYGGRAVVATPLIDRCALHAHRLAFDHPSGGRLEFTSEPPPDFEDALSRLRKGATWRA